MSMSRLSTEDRLRNKLLQVHFEAQSNPNKTLEESMAYVDAVIKLTEAQIDHKNEKRRKKRFRKNMTRPVMKLPEDIMIMIFGLLVDTAGSASTSVNKNDSESEPWWDWLIITKICQFWRNIAILTPSLWTGIIKFSNADKIEAFLSRSQYAPIDVVLHSKGVKAFIPRKIIDLFVGQVERIRRFEVIASSNGRPEQWNAIWNLFAAASEKQDSRVGSGSLLSLKRLELKDVSELSPWVISKDVSVMANSLPRNIHLQELRVKNIELPWTCQLLRGLTVLSLRYSELRYHSVSELFDILDTCPDLHSLILHGIMLKSKSHPKRMISLPQLKYIDVTMDFKTSNYFFDCIDTKISPAESEWEIYCVDYPFTSPVPFLPKFLDSGARCGADVAIYCCDDTLKFKTSNLSKTIDYSANVVSSAMFGFQRPEFDEPEDNVNSLFSTIETIMRQSFWSNLTRVSFRVNIMEGDILDVIRRSHWVRFLSLFPNIQYLAIEFPVDPELPDAGLELGFIKALVELINSNGTDGSTEIFSKLTCLRISCANFSTKGGRRARRIFVKYLVQSGKRLRNLIIDRCLGMDANKLLKLGVASTYNFI